MVILEEIDVIVFEQMNPEMSLRRVIIVVFGLIYGLGV